MSFTIVCFYLLIFQEFTKDILCNKQNVGQPISKTSIYLFLTGFHSSFVCFFKKLHPCRVSSVKGRDESIQYILRIHCLMDLPAEGLLSIYQNKITRNMSNYPWLKSLSPLCRENIMIHSFDAGA